MQLLLSVIDDLYSFAIYVITAVVRWRPTPPPAHEEIREDNILSDTDTLSVAPTSAVPSEEPVETGEVEPYTWKRVADVFKEVAAPVQSSAEHGIIAKNTVMYVGVNDVPLFKNPSEEFDSIVTKLPYGALAMVLESSDRWAKVLYAEKTGWVRRHDLIDRAAHVYPAFVIGETNGPDAPNTERVRSVIEDEFGGRAANVPLQAGEYISYRLKRKGLTIMWPPDIRPRLPGSWHGILKGRMGIHIGVVPKTGSIMEYTRDNQLGHLAYIEAVLPDETISISEANYPDRGIYSERSLSPFDWKTLQPIFIQVLS